MQFTVFAKREKRGRSLLWAERRDAFLFILPWFIGFLVFTAGPMLASLYMSFTRWEIVTKPVWVGLGQYQKLFQDDRFYLSLWNTAYYVFLGVPLHLFLALLAALAMNMNPSGAWPTRSWSGSACRRSSGCKTPSWPSRPSSS
jgi:multiple sugar transport system permease protein